MNIDSTTAWLDAAGSVPLLSKEEVITLSRTIQADPESSSAHYAINKMVAANLRLVVRIWKSSFSYVESRDPRAVDLLQEGALGLRRAATKFDATKGYTFATYSVAWVRKYMGDFLRDKDRTIRLSGDCYAVANAANKFAAEHLAKHGTKPTIEQVAAKVKKPVHSVQAYLEAYQRCNTSASLDQPATVRDDKTLTLGELVEAPEPYSMAHDTRAEKLRKILEVLFEAAGFSEEEKTIVRERTLMALPTSYTVIAALVDMDPNAVRPHFQRCMRRLQAAAQSSGISVAGTLCRA